MAGVSMMNCSSAPRWYALQVRPNCELNVVSRLEEFGIESYLPLYKTTRVPRRNKFSSGLPLFPGYVFSFMNLQMGPRLYCISGIIRIVGYGGKPTPIEEREIQMVRSISQSSLSVEPMPYFQPSERIRLIAGPLAGISGMFLSSAKGNQLVVSLPLLQRSLAVTVLSEWVKAEPDICGAA